MTVHPRTSAGERSKTFLIGRDFDPVKVGVDTTGSGANLGTTTVKVKGNTASCTTTGTGDA